MSPAEYILQKQTIKPSRQIIYDNYKNTTVLVIFIPLIII